MLLKMGLKTPGVVVLPPNAAGALLEPPMNPYMKKRYRMIKKGLQSQQHNVSDILKSSLPSSSLYLSLT